MQNKYTGAVGWCINHAKSSVASLLVICVLTVFLAGELPSTLVPDEDQGNFFAAVQLPEGTSLNRTYDTMEAIRKEISDIEGISNVMTIAGYDILSSSVKSNAGTFFIKVTSWDERTTPELRITSIIDEVNYLNMNHPESMLMAIQPPSLPGLGMVGGWSMQLQDMTGHSDKELEETLTKILMAANQRPELEMVYSTFSTDSPICKFEMDRDKIKQLGIDLSDVFTALQVNYGGAQVDDFVQFGRTYKVVLQSDAQYRNEAEALKFSYVRNSAGDMVPLDTLLTPKLSTSTSVISRFNGARSLSIQGGVAEGYSSGQAIQVMEEIVRENAPTGFTIEWSGQSREEKKSAGTTGKVLVLSIVFVFLCLAALLGCMPLALASGAGAAARNSMGTAVVGGMFFAVVLGLFLIPVMYFIVVLLSSKTSKQKKSV